VKPSRITSEIVESVPSSREVEAMRDKFQSANNGLERKQCATFFMSAPEKLCIDAGEPLHHHKKASSIVAPNL